ncbi:MAG: signal peptidase I [bacterium]
MTATSLSLTLQPSMPTPGLTLRWPRPQMTHDPAEPIPLELHRSTGGVGTSGGDTLTLIVEGGTVIPPANLPANWKLWQTKLEKATLVRVTGTLSGNDAVFQVLPDPEERSIRVQAQWGAYEGEAGVALQPSFKQSFRETFESVIYAFFIAIVLRTFFFQAFYIPSESMVPTLEVRDRLVANKFLYSFRQPTRQEIVIFRVYQNMRTDQQALVAPPTAQSKDWQVKDFIKRVIGLPGDMIEIRDSVVSVNGKPLDEPYLSEANRLTMQDYGPHEVEAGHIFVMGDNRRNSKDSRFIGDVPSENIVGKAHFVFWPFDHATWLH